MRKLNYFLFALCLSAFSFFSCADKDNMVLNIATPEELSTIVSYEDALAEVNALLDYFEKDGSGLKTSNKRRNITSYYTTKSEEIKVKSSSNSEEEEDYFVYVFNFEEDEGYAIISGDTRTVPVLAFAESGSLDEGVEVDNPGLMMFLANTETVMHEFFRPMEPLDPWGGGTSSYTTYTSWVNNQVFGTQIAAQWNQWYPYNNLCPIVNGSRPPAGCVPIAVA